MNVNQFTCAHCRATFTTGRSDEDALREYDQLFPESSARGDETAVLCDDCWRKFMDWAEANGIRL